jgi:hypothetical protein
VSDNSTVAQNVRTAIKRIRILRHDVRVKLELAWVAPSDEWRSLEGQLRDLEAASAPASEASRAAVFEGMRKLEKFSDSLPYDGLRISPYALDVARVGTRAGSNGKSAADGWPSEPSRSRPKAGPVAKRKRGGPGLARGSR